MSRSVLLLWALLVAACNPLYSTDPVGEKPRNLAADRDAWEGTWVHSEGAITIGVRDAERGQIQVAWFEKKQDTLQPNLYDVELRTFAKWTFASVKDRDTGRYVFARVDLKDRQLVVSFPNVDKWKGGIRTKQIPGTLKQTQVGNGTETQATVGPLTPKDLTWITDAERGSLFGGEPPVAFIKVTK